MTTSTTVFTGFVLRKPADNPNVACVRDLIQGITGKLNRHCMDDLKIVLTECPTLSDRIGQYKILNPSNNSRYDMDCADAGTLIEIAMMLPGARARQFRREASRIICDALGGNVEQLAKDSKHLSPEDRAFLLNGANSIRAEQMAEAEAAAGGNAESMQLDLVERKRKMDLEFRKETLELDMFEAEVAAKKRRLEAEAEERAKASEMQLTARRVEMLQGVLSSMHQLFDDRDKIWIKGLIKNTVNMAPWVYQKAIEDGPCLEKPWVRGQEIAFYIVGQEMGVNTKDLGAQIGKIMRQKWISKYNLSPDAQPPKRVTEYKGRIIKENAYYDVDTDIMRESIREVAQQ